MVSWAGWSIPRWITPLKIPNVGIDGRYCVLARASKSSSKYHPFGNVASCQPRPYLYVEYSMARKCLQSCIVNGLRNECFKFFIFYLILLHFVFYSFYQWKNLTVLCDYLNNRIILIGTEELAFCISKRFICN